MLSMPAGMRAHTLRESADLRQQPLPVRLARCTAWPDIVHRSAGSVMALSRDEIIEFFRPDEWAAAEQHRRISLQRREFQSAVGCLELAPSIDRA
jgi:hypothetical protein